jgi:hypothetical protein
MSSTEEQHESDVQEHIHVGINNSMEGGRCLNRHEAEWKPHSCSHRWQAFKHALEDSQLYNWPAYKKLVTRGKDIRTDALKDHTSKKGEFFPIFPKGYRFLLKAPAEKEWDVAADLGNRNFKWSSRTPYLHNAHHLVTNSKLREAIVKSEKKFSGFDLIVRKGLARAGYNLNHKENMVILPMDKKVAGALNLPRHLITPLHRDHHVYSKHVAQELSVIMQEYEEQLSDYLKNRDKEHVKLEHELCKERIVFLSKQLYDQVTSRMSRQERESAGFNYEGTLDSMMQEQP